jgi:hypothetical protein
VFKFANIYRLLKYFRGRPLKAYTAKIIILGKDIAFLKEAHHSTLVLASHVCTFCALGEDRCTAFTIDLHRLSISNPYE